MNAEALLESPLATGEIWSVAGPVVVARDIPGVRLYNVVRVGEAAFEAKQGRIQRTFFQVNDAKVGVERCEALLVARTLGDV